MMGFIFLIARGIHRQSSGKYNWLPSKIKYFWLKMKYTLVMDGNWAFGVITL